MRKRSKHKKQRNRTTSGKGRVSAVSWVSGLTLILGLGIIGGVWLEKNAVIRDVRFSGHFYTEKSDLESSFESPVGLHPDSIRFMDVIESVEALPWVKKAGVRVDAGRRMVVDVEERVPAAILAEGGQRTYVDTDGVKMPALPGKSVNVPLLHGFTEDANAEVLTGTGFDVAGRFLAAVKENEIGWITISEIAYNREEGIVALTYENDVKLLFGHDDFNRKMDYWQAFYMDVIREKGIENFSSVDIRYQNQIVTR